MRRRGWLRPWGPGPGWLVPGWSLLAVFCSLGVGVAVGAAAVSGRMVDRHLVVTLERRFASLERRLEKASAGLRQARRELALYRRAVQELAPLALAGRWPAGVEVEVVGGPGAVSLAREVASFLKRAGIGVRLRPGQEAGQDLLAPLQAPPGMPWVQLVAPGARVVGFPRPSGPQQAVRWQAGGTAAAVPAGEPGAAAWVEGIDEPVGVLAALEALLSCRPGFQGQEEALARIVRRAREPGLQRDRACLAGGEPGR
ncbi:MAG TPA: copper transporter [Limnochordales bacterium]